jgi:dihydrolipoamide dehydrogenase
MHNIHVDVAVIGAGTAGLAAYRAAKASGASVVLLEGGNYGTTCARVGCMPSKLLIAAADAAHAVSNASAFGIHVEGNIRIDGREVMHRVRCERDRFVDFVLTDMQQIPSADRVYGKAHFIDEHTIAVDDKTRVLSKSAVIATGSSATYPDFFKALGDRLIINDDIFDWGELPEAVAVIGAGIIGLELGQALHRLGVHVTVFGRNNRIGAISDPEINAYAITAFNDEFSLEANAHITSMQREHDRDRVAIESTGHNSSQKIDYFDYVLAATGRAPNLAALGLEHTGLELDAKGVPSFDPATMRTVNSHGTSAVFMAGDASNYIPLLHEAADEGSIAGENAARVAAGHPVKPGLRRAPIGIVFTDPQIAIVGDGFRALKPGTFATGQVSFENQGRARILLKNKGLLNIYAESSTGRLLGAEMMAPAAEHLAHLLAWSLQKNMTVSDMLDMPFYHPVIEEGVRTALRDLQAKLGSAHV